MPEAEATTGAIAETGRTSRLATLLQVARARPRFALGYVIVLAAVLAGALAPLVAPYSPVEANPAEFLQPPSAQVVLAIAFVNIRVYVRLMRSQVMTLL